MNGRSTFTRADLESALAYVNGNGFGENVDEDAIIEMAAYAHLAAMPAGTGGEPARYHVRDAEIRVFRRDRDTDDASDMYVMEVLGASVLIRRALRGEDGDYLRIAIETDHEGEFAVVVNDDENFYGEDEEG